MRKFTEEHKRKLSFAHKGQISWNKGICCSEETKKKMSDAHKNKVSPRKGAKLTEETKNKIRIANIGKIASLKTREKMSNSLKGHISWNAGKTGCNCGNKKGYKPSEEARRNLLKTLNLPEVKLKMSENQKNNWRNPKYAARQGKAISDSWLSLSLEKKEARIKKIQGSQSTKPNKQETILLNLLEEMYPNEWKYTGNFSFVVNGKCPDFVNCNGQKKIIELFGDYWHRGQDPQDRIKVFEPFGYQTLVIWQHELKNLRRVKFRINRFYRKEY